MENEAISQDVTSEKAIFSYRYKNYKPISYPYDKLFAVEKQCSSHRLKLYLSDGECECYGSLEGVLEADILGKFIQINRYTLVQSDVIPQIMPQKICLKNGLEFRVSKGLKWCSEPSL